MRQELNIATAGDRKEEEDEAVQVEDIRERASKAATTIAEAADKMKEIQKIVDSNFEQIAADMRAVSNMSVKDTDSVKAFWRQPYALVPRKHKHEYYVITPSFTGFRIGWLEKSVAGWNYFVINKYMKWLGNIPKEILDKLQFREPVKGRVHEGILYTPDKDEQDKAWNLYDEFLLKREGDTKIRIKRGREFDLIDAMIKDGILPFVQQPVKDSDWRTDVQVAYPFDKLRDYQEELLENFRKVGAAGVFWPFSAGKTVIGLHIIARIRGKKLIVVPTSTLREQWEERIKATLPQRIWPEIQIVTYHAYEKVQNNVYTLAIFDEAHRLPATTFSRMSTIRATYRLGLSATPFREDGREDLIFALTGFPFGMDWSHIIQMGYISIPRIIVHLVRDNAAKVQAVTELVKDGRKTLIYSYWIDQGKEIAKKLQIPFVYGSTKGRLDVLRKNNVVAVSSVGNEGVSLPELERVIEIGFLYGSRREEAQLVGRLFHSQAGDEQVEHHLFMTDEEIEKYEKRLLALYERNFELEIIR